MQVLSQDLEYEEVTEIFVRVNSLGVKLRSADLAVAQITARWRDSLRLFEGFQQRCEAGGFDLDLGNVVRGMVILASRQSRFKTVAGIPLEKLQTGWDDAKNGIDFALNFLRENAGVEGLSVLSSPFIVFPIAVLHHVRDGQLNADDEIALRRWIYTASAKGRYSGSAETRLDEDLRSVFDGSAVDELLRHLQAQVGRLDIDHEDLVGRNRRSPLFSSAFLALKLSGARDWMSGLNISLGHTGIAHRIQFHHIFPKALLRQSGYAARDINEIANMAFIGGKTNRRIGAKPPEIYFQSIIEKQGEEALISQAIPMDPKLWRVDRYPDFLAARRQLLVGRINQLLQGALNSGT